MKIFFGGVRGTAPCAAARFMEYGGHTTCLLVSGQQEELVMIDAGSGVQEVNHLLRSAEHRQLLVLLTHLHLDHILGLPTLAPLYDKSWRVDFAGAGRNPEDLAAGLAQIVSPPLWPIRLADMGARITFPEIPASAMAGTGSPLQLGGLEIRGTRVPHPDGCVSWRVDEPETKAAMVFATDLEWSAASEEQKQGLINLCRHPHPADLLVMEGHFTAEELPRHAGWGHSSADQALEVAAASGVGRLVITHHDPHKDDNRLGELEDEIRRRNTHATLARQGKTIILGN